MGILTTMVQQQQLVPALGFTYQDLGITCGTCHSKTLMSEAHWMVLRKLGLHSQGFPLQTLDSAQLQITHFEGVWYSKCCREPAIQRKGKRAAVVREWSISVSEPSCQMHTSPPWATAKKLSSSSCPSTWQSIWDVSNSVTVVRVQIHTWFHATYMIPLQRTQLQLHLICPVDRSDLDFLVEINHAWRGELNLQIPALNY